MNGCILTCDIDGCNRGSSLEETFGNLPHNPNCHLSLTTFFYVQSPFNLIQPRLIPFNLSVLFSVALWFQGELAGPGRHECAPQADLPITTREMYVSWVQVSDPWSPQHQHNVRDLQQGFSIFWMLRSLTGQGCVYVACASTITVRRVSHCFCASTTTVPTVQVV